MHKATFTVRLGSADLKSYPQDTTSMHFSLPVPGGHVYVQQPELYPKQVAEGFLFPRTLKFRGQKRVK